MSMKARDKNSVQAAVENEGFDYAFKHYSDFVEVRDAEFHKLRTEYILARDKLADYIGIDE